MVWLGSGFFDRPGGHRPASRRALLPALGRMQPAALATRAVVSRTDTIPRGSPRQDLQVLSDRVMPNDRSSIFSIG